MKKNGFIALLLCVALVLCACGGSSEAMDRYQYNGVVADGAVAETWASSESMKEEPGAAGSISNSTSLDAYADPNAKLIRTVYMDAQTREYDAVMAGLDAKSGSWAVMWKTGMPTTATSITAVPTAMWI